MSPFLSIISRFFLSINSGRGAEDAVYESMQTQALREGVNQLPEVQKRRLQMYFFDGLTYEEIAVREGCSYQAVQKSIAAALKKIRKFLK